MEKAVQQADLSSYHKWGNVNDNAKLEDDLFRRRVQVVIIP